MKLTKSQIEKVQPPKKGYTLFRDESLKGFALRVTASGVKAFVLEKRIHGRFRRLTIGRFGEITPEQARKRAKILIGQIVEGKDPVVIKKANSVRDITLEEVARAYFVAREKGGRPLKASTVKDYRRALDEGLADWLCRPLRLVTKDLVLRRHEALSRKSQARADITMRVLRAFYNFATLEYEDENERSLFPENPVRKISQRRAWNNVKRRETYIKRDELKPWFRAVQGLADYRSDGIASTAKDFLQFVLLTGLRLTEAKNIQWGQVDLRSKALIVYDTKNRKDLSIPMSNYVVDLLSSRQKRVENANGYVFVGKNSNVPFYDPRVQIEKIFDLSGVRATTHDLRRTYITVAESLDISSYAIKRLVNHSLPSSDVTAGYIGWDTERLREPQQLITDSILESAGVQPA